MMQTGSVSNWTQRLAQVTAGAAAYYIVRRLRPLISGHAAKLQAIDTEFEQQITEPRLAEEELAKLTSKEATGKIIASCTIARDITMRKRVESELQRDREALALRLHDTALQSLTAIRMHLKIAQRHISGDLQLASQHLAKIERLLSEEQQNLRSFVRELKGIGFTRPIQNSTGLVLMEKLAERLESQWDVRVGFEITQDVVSGIPDGVLENLLYMVQEGVANAVRHGQASAVKIEITREDSKLLMRIRDNGKGFPFHGYLDEASLAAHRAAPAMLKNRVASLGGSLSVQSADSGACLLITLPTLSKEGVTNGN
jgi:signal transduction histidine kinase